MKKSVPPAVAAAVVIVAVILIGWFLYRRTMGSGLSTAEEEKYLKPLQLGPGQQMPAPPRPGGQLGLPGPGPGGAGMPMPPPPR